MAGIIMRSGPDDEVTVASPVFRGLIDLALENERLDDELRTQLLGFRAVKGISLNLLDSALRSKVEEVLLQAAERAVRGDVASASGSDVARGNSLIQGGRAVESFLKTV